MPVSILEQNIIEAPFINSMLFLLISPEFDIVRLEAMLASARRGQWARETHEQNDEKRRGWFIPRNKAPRLPEITIRTEPDEESSRTWAQSRSYAGRTHHIVSLLCPMTER